MPRDKLPVDRDTIRDAVRKMRAHDSNLTVDAAHQAIEKMFSVKIARANFYTTYWKKADPEQNGAEAPAERKQRRPRRKLKAGRRPKHALVPKHGGGSAVANGNGVSVVGQPIIQVFELSDGKIRLQADMAPHLAITLQTIGAVLSGRKTAAAVEVPHV